MNSSFGISARVGLRSCKKRRREQQWREERRRGVDVDKKKVKRRRWGVSMDTAHKIMEHERAALHEKKRIRVKVAMKT